MSGPYVWQREFWVNAGEGFRDGWVSGAIVGQGFTMAIGIVALHAAGWVAVIAFALWCVWLVAIGYIEGRRAGIWIGEARAAKRQYDAIEHVALHDQAFRAFRDRAYPRPSGRDPV